MVSELKMNGVYGRMTDGVITLCICGPGLIAPSRDPARPHCTFGRISSNVSIHEIIQAWIDYLPGTDQLFKVFSFLDIFHSYFN